jgi:hypothetical protein
MVNFPLLKLWWVCETFPANPAARLFVNVLRVAPHSGDREGCLLLPLRRQCARARRASANCCSLFVVIHRLSGWLRFLLARFTLRGAIIGVLESPLVRGTITKTPKRRRSQARSKRRKRQILVMSLDPSTRDAPLVSRAGPHVAAAGVSCQPSELRHPIPSRPYRARLSWLDQKQIALFAGRLFRV